MNGQDNLKLRSRLKARTTSGACLFLLALTILGRLAKEGLIQSEWMESSQGPPRKYYTLTLKGEEAHRLLEEEFRKLVEIVANVQKTPEPDTPDIDLNVLSVKKETNHD
jgi:DNA-binding PadR family transcriptional regulator